MSTSLPPPRSESEPTRRLAISKLFHVVFIEETDNTLFQLIRYTFVGGLAFVVDFCLLALFTEWCGIHYMLSAALAFVGGLFTNYLISTIWVFSRRTMENRKLEFLIFAGIGVIGLGLNEAVIWSFTELVGIHYLLSKLISTVFVYLFNFFARKVTLFR